MYIPNTLTKVKNFLHNASHVANPHTWWTNFSRESPDCDHEYEPIANPQLMLTVTHQVPSLPYGNWLYYITDSTLEYLKISKQGLRLGRGKQQRRERGLVSLRLTQIQQRYKAATLCVLGYILMHLFHTHPAANQGGVHGGTARWSCSWQYLIFGCLSSSWPSLLGYSFQNS
jgi:hypothetical protein